MARSAFAALRRNKPGTLFFEILGKREGREGGRMKDENGEPIRPSSELIRPTPAQSGFHGINSIRVR